MKINLVILLIIGISNLVFSQKAKTNTKLDQLHKLQKEDTENEFKSSAIPEKYKNESLILVSEKLKVTEKYGEFTIYKRNRIKLNDYKSLETFSSFEFNENDVLEIIIEKENNIKVTIDLKDAVLAENVKTSNLKINKLIETEKVKKIAINGLEIGDIIDISTLYTSYNYKSNYFINLKNMPIVFLKNEFNFSKGYVAYFRSFNGAKDIKTSTLLNKTNMVYEQKNIDKRIEEILDYEYLTEPYYFIEIVSNLGLKTNGKNVINKLDDKVLKEKVNMMFAPFEQSDYYYDFLKTDKIYELSNEEYVKKYYYFCRDNYFLTELAFNSDPEVQNYKIINKFITHFTKRNIEFDVLLLSSKFRGSVKDVINFDDFKYGIRYKIDDEYHYITSFNKNSNIDEIGDDFEGTEAYVFYNVMKKRKINFNIEKLPENKANNNFYNIDIVANFSKNNDSLNIFSTTIVGGLEKQTNTFNLLDNRIYYDLFIQKYEAKKLLKNKYFFVENEYANGSKEFIDSEEERLKNYFYNTLDKYKYESMKKNTQSEYQVLKYYDYTKLNDSRNDTNLNLSWSEKFSIGSTLQKAGNSYVFEIGDVLGQLFVVKNNDDRNVRTKPFYIDFNKNLSITSTIKIPIGKKAIGIEYLNLKFSNKIGTITSKATIENGNIIWNLTKTQNAFKYNKTDWKEYINFTDLVLQLNNAKIIID
ncbi:MAG: hypothetical protein ACOYMA_02175 [Bacteroidia bacterium]